MGLNLTDNELDAMDGLPHFHRCLYIFGIRRYMDYASGIVGIKREISYKSLAEEVYEEPIKGVKNTTKSRDQIKRALSVLEKKALIKRQSIIKKDEKTLILSCPLAMTDKSIQNKAAPWPPHSAAPQAALGDACNQNKEKAYKNSVPQDWASATAENKSRPASRPSDFEKAAPHPLSDITKLNSTILRTQNFLTVDENKFLNLFTDLRLTVNLAGDLKAITTAKTLIQAGVTIQEAQEALEVKLAAYKGNRTPHPSYFLQAILDYKKDLTAIQQQPEVTHEHKPATTYTRPRITHAERRKRMAEWAAKKERELEEERPESDNLAL
jgi:hypothetical protein